MRSVSLFAPQAVPTTGDSSFWKELVVCYLDLAAKNIIITRENVIGIVDWETLSSYPPIFELAAISYARNIVDWEELCFTKALEF